ncbi:protein TRANSPARENT TESTA 9 [Citrus sinensis]|uniref:Protein TRANSPARENT TESTA 9 n=1 Tax=Citrus sinensis TaxID=2711 RepID=A0ACB8P5Q1_CITSI|nr:protein TRANSPARENT TESTA 9 [Citrus sinensis]
MWEDLMALSRRQRRVSLCDNRNPRTEASVGADEVTKSTTPHKSLPKERYEDHSICENAPASPALEVNVLGVGLKNVARDCFLDVIIHDTLRNSPFDELLKLEELDREATYRQCGKEKNIYHFTIMWFSFWRSRDRLSLDELRYLTDQLQKVQIVNEFNKDFVIEALRSIAELLTYGDQHNPAYFEFFMEKQVMGEFVRILKVSRTHAVSLQLLQTLSIMIQNLKSEHAIYYLFSNEHINYLISYSFDFRNEELLSYYISFLRAISGKLNKNTISLLVKTQNDEVVSFPLYSEAIRFAFHEESMVRIAVLGDDNVNRYITSSPHAEYFSNLVSFFRKQCIELNKLVSSTLKNPDPNSTSTILAAVDEIEDNLYYFSDAISAGIPDIGRLLTDNCLQLLILPLLLPSLRMDNVNGIEIGAVTSLYLLCCILRIVKIKDLANTIAAALFCPPEAYIPHFEAKLNGFTSGHGFTHESQLLDNNTAGEVDGECLRVTVSDMATSSHVHPQDLVTQNDCNGSHLALRMRYMLAELFAILLPPEQKEMGGEVRVSLVQALVGEGSDEEQLFSRGSSTVNDGTSTELDGYLQRLKEQYGVLCSFLERGTSPHVNRCQVLDALVSLFCRSNISAETLWDGGWLLRQLLPYSEAEFNSHHHELLKGSYKNCTSALLQEIRGVWPDLLITVLCDEWKKCKRVIEASSPRKDPKCILLPVQKSFSEDVISGESSFTAGDRMCESVKVFVLLLQLQMFSLGRVLPDHPPTFPPSNIPENSRARAAGLDISGPKPGTELRLVDAVPCRIAFERGKERHFSLLAISMGTSGWIVLAEELPVNRQFGVVRVAAPLAGSNPRIDEKHSRWLHLRIRPSALPFMDPSKSGVYNKVKSKALVDGRWTLAFRDEESCKSAFSMILEEMNLQFNEVERRLRPLLDLERDSDFSNLSPRPPKALSSNTTASNSL